MTSSRMGTLLLIASLVLSAIYGLYLMYIVLTPLYSFRGVVSGEVAVAWYKLEMNGEKIHLSTLDTIRILAFPLYTLGFFSVTIGILGSLIAVRKPRLKQVIMEMNLAAALSAIIYSALIVQLGRLIAREAFHLDIDLVYTNNAGLVNFGQTEIYKHAATSLLNPGPVLAITTLYLVITAIALITEQRTANTS